MAGGRGVAVTSTLSMAHHQSFPASERPKVMTICLASSGFLSVTVTCSFVLSALKSGPRWEPQWRTSTGSPPSNDT